MPYFRFLPVSDSKESTMKRLSLVVALMAGLWMGMQPLLAQTAAAPIAPPSAGRGRTSPHDTVSGILEGSGDAAKRVILVYGRPNVSLRGGAPRKIWGGLVPWGTTWRLGADEATLMITPVPLQFGDVTVPAGVSSVYLLPVENGTSQLIFNKKIGQWGINGQQVAYPDSMKETEIGRVDLKKDTLTANVDSLTIVFAARTGGGGGTMKIAWETTQYSVDFSVKK
jgi:hypothetical protein